MLARADATSLVSPSDARSINSKCCNSVLILGDIYIVCNKDVTTMMTTMIYSNIYHAGALTSSLQSSSKIHHIHSKQIYVDYKTVNSFIHPANQQFLKISAVTKS
jgi:hypothetical protein